MIPEEKKSKLDLGIDTQKIKGFLLNFVIPLIAMSISLLLIFLYVRPSITNIPIKKQELAQKVSLERTLNSKYNNLQRLVEFKSVLDEDSAMINKILVSEAEVPKMLDQVNQISDNSGLSLNRLSYSYGSSKSSTDNSFDIVSVSLGAEFNYEQMIVFLETTENAARFISIPSFRYSKGSSNNQAEEKTLSGTFSVESPYLFVQSTAVTDEPLDLDISSAEFVKFINDIKGLKYYEFLNQNVEATEEKPVEAETTETETEEPAEAPAAAPGTTPAATQPAVTQ